MPLPLHAVIDAEFSYERSGDRIPRHSRREVVGNVLEGDSAGGQRVVPHCLRGLVLCIPKTFC